jgi:hypothetical protein
MLLYLNVVVKKTKTATQDIIMLSFPHCLPKEKMSSKSPIIGDTFTIKTDHFPC